MREIPNIFEKSEPTNETRAEDAGILCLVTPARYALGFKNFQKCMLPEQYREFMSMLMAHFGRGGYFYRRRGVIAMPPAEQEIVLNALHAVGIREDIQFDAYEELVNWFD